jgi:hypothetical protein
VAVRSASSAGGGTDPECEALRPPSRARLAAAIEDNTIALRALTDEVARMNEQVARVAWLGGPLDLLRRGTGQRGSEGEDQAQYH